MDTKNALNVLIEAVKSANLKGAYTLSDSAIISKAVEAFTTQEKHPTGSLVEPQRKLKVDSK